MNRSRVTADLASHGNIFVDIANDRVGIGSTIPTHKVDISGTVKLHDTTGYQNHITYNPSSPAPHLHFPTGPLANLAKTPYLGFGDRGDSSGDFKIYHDHYNAHLKLNANFGGGYGAGLGGLFISNHSTSGVIGIQGANGSGAAQNSIYIPAGATAGVKIYQAGQLRFETVGYGVTVHGTTETQELNVTGVTTAGTINSTFINSTGNIEIDVDNGEFRCGAGGDFKISHNGSENILRSDFPTVFRNAANNETLAKFTPNEAVRLYYNNSQKFVTTNTGAIVSGILTATTFSGALSGNATSADTVDVSGAGNANTEFYVTFAETNGAAQTIKIDNGIRYNASSNVLTASYFSGNGANLTSVNATTLDSIDSGSFLRSDANDTIGGILSYTSDDARLQFTNSSYATSLYIGGWTTTNSNNISRIRSSTGNLHIDSAANGILYLNHYSSGGVFANGNEVLTSADGPVVNPIVTKDDLTSRFDSGFYESSTATTAEGWPVTSNGWYHLIASTHSNTGNYYSMQIAGDFFTQDNFYIRSTNTSGTRAWSKIWTTSSDGSGSGLDADTLDGVQGSSFLRSDVSDTTSGNITFSNDGTGIFLSGGGFFKKVGTGLIVRLPSGGQQLQCENNSGTVIGTYFHSGIDGSGSGFDADLLDGVQGSSFLRSDATDTTTGKLIIDHNSSPMLELKPTNGSPWAISINRDDISDSKVFTTNPSSQGVGWVFEHCPYFYNTGGFNKFLTTADEGSGNGLDADTLDGVQGSSFLRSDANDSASGALSFSGQITHTNKVIIDHNASNMLELKPQNGGPWVISINRDDLTESRVFAHNTNGLGWVFEHTPKIYNSGGFNNFLTTADEGSGNGLDADTLDGQQGSYYSGGRSQGVNVNYVPSSGGTSQRGTYGQGVHAYQGYSQGTNRPFTYDCTLQVMGNTSTGFEISVDWLQTDRTPMKVRSLRDCCQGWSEYTDIFTSGYDAIPYQNNTLDLGSSSKRWRNLYTNDLNLSNEGGTNDVDGTWGSYTIQEGEDDLFLINKRNGKKYKFNLTEVS